MTTYASPQVALIAHLLTLSRHAALFSRSLSQSYGCKLLEAISAAEASGTAGIDTARIQDLLCPDCSCFLVAGVTSDVVAKTQPTNVTHTCRCCGGQRNVVLAS